MRRVVIVSSCLAVGLFLGACAPPEGGPGQPGEPSPTAPVPTPDPDPTDPGPTVPDGPPLSADGVRLDVDIAPWFEVPDAASGTVRDAVAVFSDTPEIRLDLVDASGRDRTVPPRSAWKVCGQDPAAGAFVAGGTVVTVTGLPPGQRCP
ncbi:hypothetical protein [Oerskovia flava]|uniref:hypothetical protein n=1 Tax=Oerskovia flava TaxID=2986422 RepID=UPI00223F9B66|nr:hypothetical protein [Oerskovia sp. JB1-3-2]